MDTSMMDKLSRSPSSPMLAVGVLQQKERLERATVARLIILPHFISGLRQKQIVSFYIRSNTPSEQNEESCHSDILLIFWLLRPSNHSNKPYCQRNYENVLFFFSLSLTYSVGREEIDR